MYESAQEHKLHPEGLFDAAVVGEVSYGVSPSGIPWASVRCETQHGVIHVSVSSIWRSIQSLKPNEDRFQIIVRHVSVKDVILARAEVLRLFDRGEPR